MNLLLRYAIRSHVGLIREGNEDSGYAGPTLLAIADGMGGAAAGELASSVVLATMARLDAASGETRLSTPLSADTMQISAHDLQSLEAGVHPADQPGMGEPDLAALGGAVVTANERLRAIVLERPELEGMGTTLTAMLWSGSRFGMVHVGDSRAYRLRDGLLEQMTADHTWVQRLIDEGRITEEEAGHHPQRSLLMRALDGRTQVEADIGTFDAFAGDRYLLCSDGLSGFVSQETLAETLASYSEPQAAVDALIELALRAGGPDNITCIVADTIDGGSGGPGGANAETAILGTVTPVVVGAASEGANHLPRYSSDAQTAQQPAVQDDFPQNHPAGRAARLRPRRGPEGHPLREPAAGRPPASPAVLQYDQVLTEERQGVPAPREPMTRSRSAPGQGQIQGHGQIQGQGQSQGHSANAEYQAEKKRGGRKPLVIGGVAVLLLGGLGYGGYTWTQGQYYVGTQGGQVVVFKGIKSFLGLNMASAQKREGDPVYTVTLPTSLQDAVGKNATYAGQSAAEAEIGTFGRTAEACRQLRINPPKKAVTPRVGSDTAPGSTLPTNAVPSAATPAAGNPPVTAAATTTDPSATPATPAAVPPAANPTANPTANSTATDLTAACEGAQPGPNG